MPSDSSVSRSAYFVNSGESSPGSMIRGRRFPNGGIRLLGSNRTDGWWVLVSVFQGRAPARGNSASRGSRQEEEPAASDHPSGRGRASPGPKGTPVARSRTPASEPSGGTGSPRDQQDPPRRRHREGEAPAPGADRPRRRRGDSRSGDDRLRPGADPRQGRPAVDHRDAPQRPAARRPPPDRVLRPDEDGRAPLARHDGRGRNPQPRRDRTRRARRRPPHRRSWPWGSCSTSASS